LIPGTRRDQALEGRKLMRRRFPWRITHDTRLSDYAFVVAYECPFKFQTARERFTAINEATGPGPRNLRRRGRVLPCPVPSCGYSEKRSVRLPFTNRSLTNASVFVC
jgi:hypothetical protein